MRWLWLIGMAACVSPFDFASEPAQGNEEGMILLESGTFLMGYPDLTPGPYGNHWKVNQQPEHRVTLSAFYLDETEVTVEDWADFLTGLYETSPSTASVHCVHCLSEALLEMLVVRLCEVQSLRDGAQHGDLADLPLKLVPPLECAIVRPCLIVIMHEQPCLVVRE